MDTVSFSRAQFGTYMEHFEGISGVFGKRLNQRKRLTDAVLEVAKLPQLFNQEISDLKFIPWARLRPYLVCPSTVSIPDC